jgi:hypothetical protein
MKGIYGLGVALALGVAGALFNFVYLSSKLKDVEKVAFIGIKKDSVVGRGEKLREEHIEPIELPKAWVGSLADVADRWELRNTVVLGKPVVRTLAGPRILVRDDYRTAPDESLVLGKDEIARFVTVDARSFVPSLLMPGDKVSFLVPRGRGPAPAQRPPPEAAGDDPGLEPVAVPPKPAAVGGDEAIGPFKVLAVGNRLATAEVWKAHRIPQMQENVLTIRVSKHEPGEIDRANELFRRLQGVEFRPVSIQIDKQGGLQTAGSGQ